MKLKVILCFVFILMMNSVFAQEQVSKKEKKREQYKETLDMINSGEFIFEANKAFAHGGRTISLTSNPNFLIISEENAEADLPFFGEAYTAIGYSGDTGIKFEGPVVDYNVKQNDDKLRIEIRFKVKSTNDLFTCYLNISYSGSATLGVDSNTRSHIRYNGKVRTTDE